MKMKIDWKALGKALWNAVKPVLPGAIGGTPRPTANHAACRCLKPRDERIGQNHAPRGIPWTFPIFH